MPEITLQYKIKAPIAKVWQALVDPEEINRWGAGPAKMAAEPNFEFSLWGGDITGKNMQVIKEKSIIQRWVYGDWEKPSGVKIDLHEEDGITTIDLLHKGYPEKEHQNLIDGWNGDYFGAMKKYLEK